MWRSGSPGVSLGITYDGRQAATLAIQPFTGQMGGENLASRVQNIIGPRPPVLEPVSGPRLASGRPSPATRSITGSGTRSVPISSLPGGWRVREPRPTLVMELHDIVYREVMDRGSVPAPRSRRPRTSEWRSTPPPMPPCSGPRRTRNRCHPDRLSPSGWTDGSQDLWIVDSDGENRRRLTNHQDISMSPAWSPTGGPGWPTSRTGADLPRIYELNLATGAGKDRFPLRGKATTSRRPTHRDGQSVVFAIVGGRRSGLFTYNLARECCFANISEGPYDDLSPTVLAGWIPYRIQFQSVGRGGALRST
jgi:hypothetical protein